MYSRRNNLTIFLQKLTLSRNVLLNLLYKDIFGHASAHSLDSHDFIPNTPCFYSVYADQHYQTSLNLTTASWVHTYPFFAIIHYYPPNPPILRTCEEIVTMSTLSRCRLVSRVYGYDNNPPRPKDTAHRYIVYMGVMEVLKIASVNWKMERCGLVMWKTSILLNGRSCRWKPLHLATQKIASIKTWLCVPVYVCFKSLLLLKDQTGAVPCLVSWISLFIWNYVCSGGDAQYICTIY